MGRAKEYADIEPLAIQAERDGLLLRCANEPQRRLMDRHSMAGRLMQVAVGMYCQKEFWERLSYYERGLSMIRTVAAEHPDWVMGYVSAAWLWGLTESLYLHRAVHVVRADNSRTRNGWNVTFHHARDIDVRQRHGILVTDLVCTVFDCARSLSFGEGLAIADAAMRMYRLTREQLERYCESHARCKGIAAARKVIRFADPLSENGGESKVRALILDWGFRRPRLQVTMVDPVNGRKRRVDFFWETDDGRIIILELDGREKYENPTMTGGRDAISVILDEKDRETNLALSRKVTIVRTTIREIFERPWDLKKKLMLAGAPMGDK
ncbi:type IV toxin-antitoxin system AbiEi family antitoxin domain-containing protein [Bifidobacterium leontopitheci]|nr:hypothetical protein [Bifidobacterium leontopitheci]